MNEKDELINQWIDKADHDLGSTKLIYLHIPKYFDTIAFHCQQVVEKYLKAILVFYDIEFQRTHNLIYLLELLLTEFEINEITYNKAILLNGFSVQIRYPDKSIFLTKEELEMALQIADEFLIYANNAIGKIENNADDQQM
jgi:HEPN domain-containing protein